MRFVNRSPNARDVLFLIKILIKVSICILLSYVKTSRYKTQNCYCSRTTVHSCYLVQYRIRQKGTQGGRFKGKGIKNLTP